MSLFPRDVFAPNHADYTKALEAFDAQDYATAMIYFLRLRDFFLWKMTNSTFKSILVDSGMDEEEILSDKRQGIQELAEQNRAKYRKLAARALYHMGTIKVFSSQYYEAVRYLVQAVEFDPERYRDDLIEVLVKKISWEQAVWKKGLERMGAEE